MGQQQYKYAIQKAEDSRQIVEEYLMGPESVQMIQAVGEILLSWQVLVMYGFFLVYRIIKGKTFELKWTGRGRRE